MTSNRKVYRRGIKKNAFELTGKMHQAIGDDNCKSPIPTANKIQAPGKGWERFPNGWGKNIRFMQSATNPLIFLMVKKDASKPCEYRSDYIDWNVKFNFPGASQF